MLEVHSTHGQTRVMRAYLSDNSPVYHVEFLREGKWTFVMDAMNKECAEICAERMNSAMRAAWAE